MSDEGKGEQHEDAVTSAEPRGWRLGNFDWLKNPPTGVAAAVYVVATLFALAVLVLVAFGLFASFQIAYESTTGKFLDRIEAAKVFFPILLALVGGPLLIWRVITAHIQAQAARHQADTGREAHYTTLFTKAVEQLGATRDETDDGGKTVTKANQEVRLGAIYALGRIAQDSERDHWPIMQVLCAYVRNPQNCGAPAPPPEGIKPRSEKFGTWLNSIRPPRVDVQAALTVIGERAEPRRGLEASKGLRLDLRHANLQGAMLESSYLERASFEGAHLDGASVTLAYLDGASFYMAHLDGASFTGAHLDGALFVGAHLDGASFSEAHLDGASFIEAHLDGASFSEAHLDGASFIGAHLEDASFIEAHLDGAEFSAAHLDGVSFFDVDLSKALGLDPVLLASAFGDASTKLRDRMERPAAWPDREFSAEERFEWVKKARAMLPKET